MPAGRKRTAFDPSQAYERLTANLLDEDKELVEQEKRESRWEQAENRIKELEEQLQSQSYEQEEQQLWLGLEQRLEEMKDQWPIAAARGVQAVGGCVLHNPRPLRRYWRSA